MAIHIQQTNQHKQFGINTLSNIFVFSFNLLIGLWFTPYLIRNLGVEAYGLIPLATTVTSYLTLITLSINGSVGRFLALDLQNNNSKAANQTFNTALVGLIFITLLVFPIFLVFIFNLPSIFNIPEGTESSSKTLFFYILLTFFITQIDTCFAVSSWAKNRFELRNIVIICSNIIRIFCVVSFFVFIQPNISYVGLSFFIAAVIGLVGDIILWRILTPDLRLHPKSFDQRKIKELFGMGGWIVMNQIGTILFINIDLIVANLVLGAKAAGEYGSIIIFSTVLRGLGTTISNVFYPTIVNKFARNELSDISRLSKQAVHFMCLVVGPIVGILCGFGSSFLLLWLGPDFPQLGLLLILTVFHLPINIAVLPLFGIQMAMNKVKTPGIVTVVMGVGNLLLALFFTIKLNWGYLGIAAAAAIVLTLKNAIFTTIYTAKIQNISLFYYIKELIPGLIVTLLSGLSALLFSKIFDLSNWFSFLAFSAVLGILFLLLIFFFGFSREEKSLLVKFLPSRIQSKFGSM